jgi:hypothetical protein
MSKDACKVSRQLVGDVKRRVLGQNRHGPGLAFETYKTPSDNLS